MILCIFYLAQVVFLKDFYMFIKEQGVTKATEQIKASLQQGYDYDEIQEIASSQDFCVYTYGIGNSDEPYYIAAIAGNFRACPNQPLLLDRYEELYLKAKASTNGTATIIMNNKNDIEGDEVKNMTTASIINSTDGQSVYLFRQYEVVAGTVDCFNAPGSISRDRSGCYCDGSGFGILSFQTDRPSDSYDE